MPGPAKFEIEQNPTTVVVVTGSDGSQYEIRLAMIVQAVFETDQRNPIDQLPIFQIASQVVTQTQRRQNG